jgi:Cys-rich repeat protein
MKAVLWWRRVVHHLASRWGKPCVHATRQVLRFALVFTVSTASACADSSISLLPELAHADADDDARPCAADADCGDRLPRCNPTTLICVDCLSDDDCGGEEPPKCLPEIWECVQCVSDADCNSDEPYCEPDGNRCEVCFLDAHCAAGEVCDTGEEWCVEAVVTP